MTVLDRPASVSTGRPISPRRLVARGSTARPSAPRRRGDVGTLRFGYVPTRVETSPIRTSPRPVDATRHLDPRVWLVWMAAVIVPALAARNPFPLLALLIVVVVVRAAWAPALARGTGWSFILRFAVIASLVSVLFNVLTAPFGDQILLELPGWWPFGDVVTANALVYGLLSAVAVVVIILAGTTAGLLADWPELLRSVPARFLPLAVAGSVAWAFVPQTVATLRDIRDAQRVRGISLASTRTLVPILVPLLATSLERATTMAEALESRGFGGSADRFGTVASYRGLRSFAAPVGLTTMVVGAYLLLDGMARAGSVVIITGLVVLLVSLSGRDAGLRSRYRRRVWRRRDTLVLSTAVLGLTATGWSLVTEADALRYSPYPDIAIPTASIPLILVLGLLLAPAVVAPLVPLRKVSARVELIPVMRQRWRHTSTVRRIPWASWPPVFRSGPLPVRRRCRPEATVGEGLAPSAPRSGPALPRQAGSEATRRRRDLSRLTGTAAAVQMGRIPPLRSEVRRTGRSISSDPFGWRATPDRPASDG